MIAAALVPTFASVVSTLAPRAASAAVARLTSAVIAVALSAILFKISVANVWLLGSVNNVLIAEIFSANDSTPSAASITSIASKRPTIPLIVVSICPFV